jgi:hypothetical protein
VIERGGGQGGKKTERKCNISTSIASDALLFRMDGHGCVGSGILPCVFWETTRRFTR